MSALSPFPAPRSSIRLAALAACLLGSLWAAGASAGETRWVSDNLATYVRSGPTDGYRIVGTLSSGQKVELLRTQGDYSQVRSESGDSVWIPTRDLQSVPGQAERLPQPGQEGAELSAELGGIDDTRQTREEGMPDAAGSR